MKDSTRRLIALVLAAPLLVGASLQEDARKDLAAGRAFQDRKLWSASDSLASVTLARLESDPGADSLAIAEALYLVGNARYRASGYTDSAGYVSAVRCLEIRSRRMGAEDPATAEAHSLLGTYLAGRDQADSALVHVRRALDIRVGRLAPDDSLLADNWDQLALILRDKRRFPEAIGAWDKAIEVWKLRAGGDHPEAALLLGQIGICRMEMGDLDGAREVLHRALEIFARVAPDHPRRWVPLNNLAAVETRSGNLALSIDLSQEALRVARPFEKTNPRPVLSIRQNLASNLLSFGDQAGALAIFRELLPQYQVQFGPRHPRTLLLLQGIALSSAAVGDTAGALRALQEVEKQFTSRGEPTRFMSDGQHVQASLLYRQGRHLEARLMSERAIRTALSLSHPDPLPVVQPLNMLVLILEALGDEAALDSVHREVKRLTAELAPGHSETRARFLYAGARAARRLGRRDEAWSDAVEAENVSLERVRSNLQALPDRRALEFTRQETRFLDLVIDMARDASTDRREVAWDQLVRSRGLVRAECIRRRPPEGLASDSLIVGAHSGWVDAQRRLSQKLVSLNPADSAARQAVEELRGAVDDAEGGYIRALAARGARAPAASVGLPDVRSRLIPGQALVSLFEVQGVPRDWLAAEADRDTGRVIAFITRGGEGGIECVELARSFELRSAVDPWRDRLAASPGPGARSGDVAEEECRRLGRQVRGLTWDRIAPHLGDVADVFLVGDGPVIDLPWHALPDGEAGYLVERGPRLHLLNAERELAEPGSILISTSLLAIGAPDFENAASEGPPGPPLAAALVRSASGPCVDGRRPALPPLPGSGLEVQAVARAWRGDRNHAATVLTGAQATEAAFKAAAEHRAILHLATHGIVAQDTCAEAEAGLRGVGGVGPLAAATPRPSGATPRAATPKSRQPSPWMARRVWLALAGANHSDTYERDENEGLLTAEEVLTLDLEGTDWVVLSACHSGVAETWRREGTLGMRRAFDLAGASTVIASGWALEDQAAHEWMTALYNARAEGEVQAAQAVESAHRAVLASRRADGRSTHPFYWAAFSATGE